MCELKKKNKKNVGLIAGLTRNAHFVQALKTLKLYLYPTFMPRKDRYVSLEIWVSCD